MRGMEMNLSFAVFFIPFLITRDKEAREVSSETYRGYRKTRRTQISRSLEPPQYQINPNEWQTGPF